MTTRLEHANIAARDLDAMVQFIGTAFPDFKVRGQGVNFQGNRRWVHIGNDGCYIAVVEALNPEASNRIPYCDEPGMNHLGFEIEDAAALRGRLLTAGYRESTIPNSHPHRTRVYFRDGEGNDWEFVEYHADEPALRNDYEIGDL